MSAEKKIFISHHSSKSELAEHLSKYLEKNSIGTWFAPRDIHSGEQWDEAINEAIRNSKAVILLFCARADSSRQVKRELALADKYHKAVFWIRVEKVEPNNLSYFLTSTQWFDWMDERDETLENLVKDIMALDDYPTNTHKNDDDNLGDVEHDSDYINSWAKNIFAFKTDREAAECAARVYFLSAQKNSDSSLILPTGRSATLIFRAMTRIADEYEDCPFGDAQILSDTETFGVWEKHETSRTRHIRDMLIEPLKKKHKAPSEEQLHLLSGVYLDDDPVKAAQRIVRLFPPSVHAISVSPVGEILAYEVGTYTNIDEIANDAPRIVEVGEHSKKYIDPNQPSKSIITIGLGTSLSSDILLVLLFDVQKASILKRLFFGPITAGIPATILRNHPNAYILTTEKIALSADLDDNVTNHLTPEEASDIITRF